MAIASRGASTCSFIEFVKVSKGTDLEGVFTAFMSMQPYDEQQFDSACCYLLVLKWKDTRKNMLAATPKAAVTRP